MHSDYAEMATSSFLVSGLINLIFDNGTGSGTPTKESSPESMADYIWLTRVCELSENQILILQY